MDKRRARREAAEALPGVGLDDPSAIDATPSVLDADPSALHDSPSPLDFPTRR